MGGSTSKRGRSSNGRFSIEARVFLSDATLLYTDQKSGKALKADSCDLNARHLQLAKKKSAAFLRSLSFTAVLTCGEIRTKDLVLSEVKVSRDGLTDFSTDCR
jgi:hypothetical protein